MEKFLLLVVQIQIVFSTELNHRKYCSILQMNIVNRTRFFKSILMIRLVLWAFDAISEKSMHYRKLMNRPISKTSKS